MSKCPNKSAILESTQAIFSNFGFLLSVLVSVEKRYLDVHWVLTVEKSHQCKAFPFSPIPSKHLIVGMVPYPLRPGERLGMPGEKAIDVLCS